MSVPLSGHLLLLCVPELAIGIEVEVRGASLREHEWERTEDECVRLRWASEHVDTCAPEPHGSYVSIHSVWRWSLLSLSYP